MKSRVGHRRRRTTPRAAHPFAQRSAYSTWRASKNKFGPPPPLANDPHQHGHNCANLRTGVRTSVRTSDRAQKKHRVGAGWVYDRRHQWHMVCRAPGATPGKKKSPLLETVGLSAKRTTYRNGRCVGINCRGIRNPLQSKWREFPCQTTPLPIPYVYARCMRRCAWGMADFLP